MIQCSLDEITYEVAPDGRSITFFPCRLTSFNTNDVEKRYCALCHRYMDLLEICREMRQRFQGQT
jgi:CRISPR/Cas system-associated protein Cas10 (large subunit of type III CRISPR-Cas system)